MVHLTDISAAFMFLSAVISCTLLVLALLAYHRNRERFMVFVAAAFGVFTAKSLVVGTSLLTGLIEHAMLELVDAAGDLVAILLFAVPLFLPGHGADELE